MADQKVPTKTGMPAQRSPIRKNRGIPLAQKQALIDNLQLEVTERARRLRAQYNLQAQGLRSRIEIRVNRIPMALRKWKMGDLLQKVAEQQQRQIAALQRPPVPEKDAPRRMSPQKPTYPTAQSQQSARRPLKRLSDDISGDKENEVQNIENPKKRLRGGPAHATTSAIVESAPTQVLSPASSNARLPRERAPPSSPPKSLIARPASPTKTPAAAARSANILSNLVEKAKSTRAAATRKTTATSSTSASSSGTAAATGRARRGAAAAPTLKTAATSRTTRRASNTSHSSESSTSTVVKKTVTAAKTAATPASKRTVMSTVKKGVIGAAAKKAPATTTTSTRVLRKRG